MAKHVSRKADTKADAMHAYYAQGREVDRLSAGHGLLEFERTKQILVQYLPPPSALVADIGGGPGAYAMWLAAGGYRVEHRDAVPLHVAQMKATVGRKRSVRSAVGDARALDLGDASVDAVLLLGPLYHLEARGDRLRALREARRVVRPGGLVFAAAISRWAMRLDGILANRIYERFPETLEIIDECERTGIIPPLYEGSFAGYSHTPQQLRREIRAAGLELVALLGIEGPGGLLADLAERMADPVARAIVIESARAVEAVPSILGAAGHLMAVGRRVG
jgi:SAM-dependent methyltransferase